MVLKLYKIRKTYKNGYTNKVRLIGFHILYALIMTPGTSFRTSASYFPLTVPPTYPAFPTIISPLRCIGARQRRIATAIHSIEPEHPPPSYSLVIFPARYSLRVHHWPCPRENAMDNTRVISQILTWCNTERARDFLQKYHADD